MHAFDKVSANASALRDRQEAINVRALSSEGVGRLMRLWALVVPVICQTLGMMKAVKTVVAGRCVYV